jgi:hypothetical protein
MMPMAQANFRFAKIAAVVIFGFWLSPFCARGDENPLRSAGAAGRDPGYAFDGKISRKVLDNYLSRSITMEHWRKIHRA